MDGQKNQKLLKVNAKPFTLKKQILTKVIQLLLNYVNTKTQQASDENFRKFKTELLKQKKIYPLFDINQPIGEIISFNGVFFKYYLDAVLYRDDLQLFNLLLECGLNDINIEGEKTLHALISWRALKCLESFLSVGDFSRHFINGEYSPLALAVSNFNIKPSLQIEALQNIEPLKMMVQHSDFKKEYLKHEQNALHLNPLLIAIANYNYNAVKYLLERGAPCASSMLPVKGFDLLFTGFLNYYSAGHSSILVTGRKQKNLSLKNEMMTQQNITRLFYFLLNHTSQESNVHQLIQAEDNVKKIDIYTHLNELLVKGLNIKDGSFKFLLDILGSSGSGLFFHDWPQKLKEKYKNVPGSAEIVMPVLSSNGQVITIYYSFSDFHLYLKNNHESFLVLNGLHQYLKNKISILKIEHPNYLKIKELEKKVSFYVSSSLSAARLKPALSYATDGDARSLLKLLSEVIANIKEIKVDKDNLSFMLNQQKNDLKNVILKIADEKTLLEMEEAPKAFHLKMEYCFTSLPRLYGCLITLNQVYRQLFSVPVYQHDLMLIRESIDLFNILRSRIDFYSLQWVYYVFYVQKIAPKEAIELVQVLTTIFDLIYKNTRINDKESIHPAYYRMQYIMQAFLVNVYSKTNNISQAKKAFKKALLILEGSNNPNLFTNAYITIFHHVVVIDGFSNMMYFGMENMPGLAHAHLCQIIQYEKGMILSEKFIQKIVIHLKHVIDCKHFVQAKELLDLLSKNTPKEKMGMLIEIKDVMVLKYTEFLKSLESKICRDNLSSQIKMDANTACLVINFQQTYLNSKKIGKMLPCHHEVDNKIVTIKFIELFQEENLEMLFLSIKKINDLDALKKQRQAMQVLEAEMASLTVTVTTEQESSNPSYTPYHTHSNDTVKKHRIEKPSKPIKSCAQNQLLLKSIIQTNKLTDQKVNVIDLKKLMGLENEYSDLIMIYSSYSKNNKKFIAIKKEPEFLGFLTASCLFKNEFGEWGINSINPYGKNQHGVKYDKKLIGNEVIHIAKLKASSADRAIGYGKEIDYEGSKVIVYVIDTILPHNKADKLFKF